MALGGLGPVADTEHLLIRQDDTAIDRESRSGDVVAAGERIGLIKFGSRVDVILGAEWRVMVKKGDRVTAGASVMARMEKAS